MAGSAQVLYVVVDVGMGEPDRIVEAEPWVAREDPGRIGELGLARERLHQSRVGVGGQSRFIDHRQPNWCGYLPGRLRGSGLSDNCPRVSPN
jgi:hypothetical protein